MLAKICVTGFPVLETMISKNESSNCMLLSPSEDIDLIPVSNFIGDES